MAGKTIIMSKLKQILRLRSNGVALQTIATSVQLSRNTVKKYLRLIEVKNLVASELLAMEDEVLEALLQDPEPRDAERLQSLVSKFQYFDKELCRTGVTRWVLWGEYRNQHPDGYSYSQFCEHYQATIEQLNFTPGRGLDRTQILLLAEGSFINHKDNVLITGATGAGKSYLASALGHQACQLGYRTAYFNSQKLFPKLKMMKADGSYGREISRIEKQDLLIIDDFGMAPLDQMARMMLMEIIEDRHGRKSTIISSQLPVAKWHEIIGDSTVADAILDRMLHKAHRIEIKGESLRKKDN
jgi:DNA replication protein DnaC